MSDGTDLARLNLEAAFARSMADLRPDVAARRAEAITRAIEMLIDAKLAQRRRLPESA